jgi:hypothetical protein
MAGSLKPVLFLGFEAFCGRWTFKARVLVGGTSVLCIGFPGHDLMRRLVFEHEFTL